MSPENLELIGQLYDAMNRRDLAAIRALGARFPDYEWRNAPDQPETGWRRGPETLAYVEELFETFDRIDTRVEEVVDLGPDAALFVVHHRVRGAASGAEGTRRETHLWRARDGRIVGMEEYRTVEEARAAAR